MSFFNFIIKKLHIIKEFLFTRYIIFTKATREEKLKMLRLPAGIIVILFLLLKFGPLFLPPQISYSYPGKNDKEVPLETKIEMVFDRPVIKSLAEKNLSFSPAISGDIIWEGDQKLIFTPKEKLIRGLHYKAYFTGPLFSRFLIPSFGGPSIEFDSIGDPKILMASPQGEAPEDYNPITVIFDRPMTALTTATNSAERKDALTVLPKITGEGRWLGTTAFQFRPNEKYIKATTYQVTVPAGIKSEDGGELRDNYTFEFSSEKPRVINTTPLSGDGFASPTASVSAVFNQNVLPQSLAEKFVLKDKEGKIIPGRIVVNSTIAGFYPDEPLRREQYYCANVLQGTLGTEGQNGTEADYDWCFTASPLPQVINSDPVDGASDVASGNFITVQFKTPMDNDSFADNITILPKPDTKSDSYFSSYDNKLQIRSYFGASTDYSVTIGGGVTDQYGVPLGKPYTFKFKTKPYNPSISLSPQGTYFAAFNQQVIPRVVAQVTNTKQINYSLFRLKREDFLTLFKRKYEGICSGDTGCYTWQTFDISKLEKVRQWTEKFDADFNTPVTVVTKVTTDGENKIPPGVYFLDAQIAEGGHDNMVMVVTRSTLTVKRSPKQIFVWAVDQSTGEVISDMKIQLTDSSNNVISEGATNKDGVYTGDADLTNRSNLFVFGQKGDDVVVASSLWNNGIERYVFGLPSYYYANEGKNYGTQQDYKLYITLDRTIFRPGQKVYFKGLVRKDNDGAYESITTGESVSVEITDARSRSVYSQNLSINSFGSFNGELDLSKEVSVGNYQIKASYQSNSYTQEFQVEEYRKPDMFVTVKPEKDSYINGESANINVNASYYFGAAAANMAATWDLNTQDYTFSWDKDNRFEFGDPDVDWSRCWCDFYNHNNGKSITSGKGITDGRGDINLNLPLNISNFKTDQKMIMEATVNDINNQSLAASSVFIVHKAGRYIGLKPESYGNDVGKEAKINMVTIDVSGKEVANVPAAVEILKRTWDTVKEQNPDDGNFYYVSKPTDTQIDSLSTITDEFGRASVSFIPKEGGTYRLVGRIKDEAGRDSVTSTFIWVSGYGYSASRENNDRILLVTDKKSYLVGEKMSLFVATPYASESARTLITAERGKVIDYQLVNTSDVSNNFPVEIKKTYTPNVFVSALLVRPGNQVKKPAEFKLGYTEIKVADKKQQIQVKITPDKTRYQPKDTLNVLIETKDLLGNPVSTEVAVGLVDKSVWDLATVLMPDIYKTFFQPRNLEVDTAQLLTISMDRINANTNLGQKGGSGGGGGGGAFDTSRSNFKDTAFWNPVVLTDQNGQANIKIQLPDNLTTWRLGAVANSKGDAFGAGEAQILVSRDVLIRPFLPRFLAVGDEAKLGAIIVNTSGNSENLKISIDSKDIVITDEKTKSVVLPDGAQQKLVWQTYTPEKTKAAIKFTVTNESGRVLDAIETSLPIERYDVLETTATSGEVKSNTTENIVLPKDINPTLGEVDIKLSPSLGSAAFSSLSYLIDYAYYCTEQTTSKLLPSVFVHRILKQGGLLSAGKISLEQIDQVVGDAVQRLLNTQKPDGGWGWWPEYESNPFLTAYAYLGLIEAKKEGYTIDQNTLNKTEKYLTNILKAKSSLGYNEMAFILYVLKDSNQNLASYTDILFKRRYELSLTSRAQLAVSLRKTSDSRAKTVLNEILSLAKKTNTTTHWEEPRNNRYGYYFMGTNSLLTATVIEAMSVINNKNPLISEAVRYLLNSRVNNYWGSTLDTSMVLKSISQLLLTNRDYKVNEEFKVLRDGNLFKEGKFSKEDLFKIQEYTIAVSDLVINADNKITFNKTGDGNLYYNLNLKYYLPFSEIASVDNGMVVMRDFMDQNGQVLSSKYINENSEIYERITLVAPADRHYVVVEDKLPAGLEAVNENLSNVSVLNKDGPKNSKGATSLDYFVHRELRDDQVVLFMEYLPAGVYEFTYRLRATTPGRYHHPPVSAYEMYTPDIFGHSDGGWLEVK